MKPSIKDAYATIALLAATWPACFGIEFAGRKPLKVGIGKNIAAVAEGAITPEELDAAMSLYCNGKPYLKWLKEGAQRVDLDGNPAGTVTAAQAANARRRIERIDHPEARGHLAARQTGRRQPQLPVARARGHARFEDHPTMPVMPLHKPAPVPGTAARLRS
jgi:ProP effector